MWIEQNPKFFIAAPFGNYIKPKGCIPVTGTFTKNPRGNRLWSVLSTLRYDFKSNGWVNKLGLPNPGLNKGLMKLDNRPNDILSIAEVVRGDFKRMNHTIPLNQNLEINLSCPKFYTNFYIRNMLTSHCKLSPPLNIVNCWLPLLNQSGCAPALIGLMCIWCDAINCFAKNKDDMTIPRTNGLASVLVVYSMMCRYCVLL